MTECHGYFIETTQNSESMTTTIFIWNSVYTYVPQRQGRGFAYEIELPGVVEEQKKMHVGAYAAVAKDGCPCTDFEAAAEEEEEECNEMRLNVKVWVD